MAAIATSCLRGSQETNRANELGFGFDHDEGIVVLISSRAAVNKHFQTVNHCGINSRDMFR